MKYIFWTLILLACRPAAAQPSAANPILPGADRMEQYLSLLEGKRVGIFANQTSLVGQTHLVDTLQKKGIKIVAIFGPEHGFRGTADAGEKVGNYVDEKTGIPVISLYGPKRRPSAEDLREIDVLVFDIQDVGVRFYTFISSLEEYILAAMEAKKPLLLLDRPNPNGHYVDGPVLDTRYRSFVGMQPVPIVYGMTMGEYARMLLGEGWLNTTAAAPPTASLLPASASVEQGMTGSTGNFSTDAEDPGVWHDQEFHLRVIRCANYDHRSLYTLPVKPSPNLPNIQSIYLYPFTCLFEGTALSEGRGTEKPFQVFGHPSLPKNLFSFTPNPNPGAKSSKHYGKVCYGWDLSGSPADVMKKVNNRVQLKWILEAYRLFPAKDSFFLVPKSGKMEQSFITKLAGYNEFWQQVRSGKTEAEIRQTWEPGLSRFRETRKKYLLYEDF
jgi:uncharacterized protein YbbC (DUF1343 family)